MKQKTRIRKNRVYRSRGKSQPVLAVGSRETRDVIVSFRLRPSEADLLQSDLESDPIAGVKSLKQFARKLTVDYARGRTVYINEVDRAIDPDARERIPFDAPDCGIEDKDFLRKLRSFLRSGDNWNRLRMFLLQYGWPEDAANKYAAAKTEKERLDLVQDVLMRMLKK